MDSITNLKEIEATIEALLFAAGDPVPLDRISEIIGQDKKTTRLILNNMMGQYMNESRGIMLRELDASYQLCTKPQYYEHVMLLVEPRHKQGLSQAAFETLAIIAYNQPVTRAKIEQIRGVSSDSAITKLLERNLIQEAGRLDAPGKPMIYETTEEFLKSFGFKSVHDLPILELNELESIAVTAESEI